MVIVFYFRHEIETDLKNGTHCLGLQLAVVHEEFQVFVEQDLEQEEEVSEIYLSSCGVVDCNRYAYCIFRTEHSVWASVGIKV